MRNDEPEFKVALRALHLIKTYGGIICVDCLEGLIHPECKSSERSWEIAVEALDKISKIQKGEFNESG